MNDFFFVKNGTERFKLSETLSSRWQKIGIVLGIENNRIRDIDNEYRQTEEKYREILSIWLNEASNLPNSDDYPLSWEGLKTLLEDISMCEVAKQYFSFLDAIPQDQ